MTPKSEKVRTIRVPIAVAVELRRHLREYPHGGLLFRGVRSSEMLRRDRLYASVGSSVPVYSNSVVRIDPHSGVIEASVFMGIVYSS